MNQSNRLAQKSILILFTLSICFFTSLLGSKVYAEKILTKITASYNGDKIAKGEELNPDDFTVKAYYSDDTSQQVYDFTLTPDTMKGNTSQTVRVTYSEDSVTKTDSTTVYADIADLDYIEASYMGGSQTVGGQISKSDVRVVAKYEDGQQKVVTSWTFGEYNITSGNNSVPIFYKENGITQQDTITVYGVAAELSRIQVSYIGTVVGIDGYVHPDDIKVTAYYRDINKTWGREVTHRTVDAWTVDSYSIQEGSNYVTVRYSENGKTVLGRCTVLGSKLAPTWVNYGGIWKYRQADSTYLSNAWIFDHGKWYYMDALGNMATGWIQVDGLWYCLSDFGVLYLDTITPDGFYVNAQGVRE